MKPAADKSAEDSVKSECVCGYVIREYNATVHIIVYTIFTVLQKAVRQLKPLWLVSVAPVRP